MIEESHPNVEYFSNGSKLTSHLEMLDFFLGILVQFSATLVSRRVLSNCGRLLLDTVKQNKNRHIFIGQIIVQYRR